MLFFSLISQFLSWVLLHLEASFGLKINLDKSELIPMEMVANVDELAAELGCKVGSLSTTYFGLPLGAAHESTTLWDGVEERIRVSFWKRSYISKGGRVTLISTLASRLIYQISLLRMPKVVVNRLEKI